MITCKHGHRHPTVNDVICCNAGPPAIEGGGSRADKPLLGAAQHTRDVQVLSEHYETLRTLVANGQHLTPEGAEFMARLERARAVAKMAYEHLRLKAQNARLLAALEKARCVGCGERFGKAGDGCRWCRFERTAIAAAKEEV